MLLKINLSRVVTYWVQRNLSPAASLQWYANCSWETWKEKTPHQRTSEALLFTLSMPTSNVGGRTTFFCDKLTLQFAHYENIHLKFKNIFTFLAIIAIPLFKLSSPLQLLAAGGQNGKSVLTKGKKFSKVWKRPPKLTPKRFDFFGPMFFFM